MSEPISVTLRFKIRPEWFDDDGPTDACPPGVVEFLDYEYNDWGEGVTHGGHEYEFGGDMNYGFGGKGYEEAFVKLGVAFVAHDEAKYEFDGDIMWWMPGMEIIDGRSANQGGSAMLDSHTYGLIRKEEIEEADELTPYLDRLMSLDRRLTAYFVDPWELLDKAPEPPPYKHEET